VTVQRRSAVSVARRLPTRPRAWRPEQSHLRRSCDRLRIRCHQRFPVRRRLAVASAPETAMRSASMNGSGTRKPVRCRFPEPERHRATHWTCRLATAGHGSAQGPASSAEHPESVSAQQSTCASPGPVATRAGCVMGGRRGRHHSGCLGRCDAGWRTARATSAVASLSSHCGTSRCV